MTLLFNNTHGFLSKITLLALSRYISQNGKSYSTNHKHYVYINNFLKHLALERDRPEIATLSMYFRMPKVRKEIKLVTSRIIVMGDIENSLRAIEKSTLIDDESKAIYKTLTLFLAYTGQRVTTVSRLTIGQFREALKMDQPVLTVEARQDKIRMAHYCPLHPMLIESIRNLAQGKPDDVPLFGRFGLQSWFRRNPVPLQYTHGKMELKDLRKFFIQKSDEIGFTDANKNFILTHNVSGVDWQSYKQFLPQTVYNSYMKAWGDVKIW